MSSENNQYNIYVGFLVQLVILLNIQRWLSVIIIVPCYNCGFIKEVLPESYWERIIRLNQNMELDIQKKDFKGLN